MSVGATMAEPVSLFVVIPYAGEATTRLVRTVESALESMFVGDVESGAVLVIADGCGVPEWALRAPIQWAMKGKSGLPGTINFGAGFALAPHLNTTHICWLSTGDTLHRDRFKHPLPTDKGQCCQVRVESRGVVLPDLGTNWQQGLYRDNQFCGSGMVVPVSVWDAVGGFDEGLTYCSDWDFAVRVQHRFGWECVGDTVLATANEYPDGLTRRAVRKDRDRDRAMVKRLATRLGKLG